jgi:hypothetical protein
MVSQVCECLGDVIAVKGLCESRTDCTVYLNDVRGVSNKMLELLADDDHSTADDVLQSLIAEAGPSFVQTVKASIGEKYREKTLIKTISTARWRTPTASIAAEADTLRGWRIFLEPSPYIFAEVGDAELYSDGSGSASEPLNMYDLDTGEVIDTFPFDNSVAGFKSIRIKTRYFGRRRLFLAYNAANVITNEIDPFGLGYYNELCQDCGCGTTYANCAKVDSTGAITYGNTVGTSNCGMRLQYSLGCSIEPYICINRETFAHGFKYAVAMELFSEMVASERLNQATLKTAEEIKVLFDKAANKLDIFLTNLKNGVMPDCGICFPCAEKLSYTFYTIP